QIKEHGWGRKSIKEEVEDSCMEWKWKIGSRRGKEEMEVNEKELNPKDPNFLPLFDDEAEGEKVDLKHQMMDERRNSEEWMIHPSLQQTVTKLATARKRKVALLVEAFKTLEAEKGENVDTSSLDCQDEAEIDELEANLKAEDAEDRDSIVANQGTWMGKKEHQGRG
ncbi:Calmodulin binding protein PICBP, partial [Linum perenne]